MSSVAQRISGTFLATAAVYATAALTGPLAARLLGPEGRGTLAAIQLWPGVLAMVAMLGLSDAIVYFGAREPGRAAQWLFTAQFIALGAACVVVCIGYPIVSVALRNYDPSVVWAAHLYLLLIPVQVLIGIPSQLARAVGRFGLWNILRIVPGLAWLAILVLSFQGRSTSPETLALAFLGFLGVEAFVITLVCVRVFSTTQWFDPASSQEAPPVWYPLRLRRGSSVLESTAGPNANCRVPAADAAGIVRRCCFVEWYVRHGSGRHRAGSVSKNGGRARRHARARRVRSSDPGGCHY